MRYLRSLRAGANSLRATLELEHPPSLIERRAWPVGRLAKRAVILALVLVLPLALAACFGSDGDRPSLMGGTQAGGPQPFPDNFRSDTLALMRAYLNNPVGVREATMADPVLREIGGRQFYVACLPALHATRDRRQLQGHARTGRRLRQRAGRPHRRSRRRALRRCGLRTLSGTGKDGAVAQSRPSSAGARTGAAGAAGSQFGEL
ncbi:hypothetical protein ACVIJW_009800 [Bradyrhizobium barranii subsp. barranii]